MYDIGPYRINSVQCTKCEQTITSRNRHDFVTCKCGAISVDGGSWYLKRSGSPMDYMELSKSYADE
jgi:ribosomal protein L37AE/L43A